MLLVGLIKYSRDNVLDGILPVSLSFTLEEQIRNNSSHPEQFESQNHGYYRHHHHPINND